MARQKHRVFMSLTLIALGIFFLLNNFRLLGDVSELVWAGIFGAAGLFGLNYYRNNDSRWWVLFPSGAFLGIAGTIIAGFIPFLHPFEGGIFMLAFSLAFWIIFAREPEQWWAAIPAGVLATIAFVATVDEFVHTDATGSLFFIGLGLTFAVLWLTRDPQTAWAKWPALGATGFGLFLSVVDYFDRAWPLILIAVGGWILLRNLSDSRKPHPIPPSGEQTE
ncbi:MAG: hypothetical protein ACE5G8_03720 [Anaerolineae bacterium]